MNSKIAKNRLSEVVRIDTITSSQGDFLATHVPIKKIQVLKKFVTNSSNEKYYPEEDVYNNIILNPKNKHQFILVIGSSGAGKSHLIRWFDAKLEQNKPEDEVVLFVRRSDNSLKGTIKQLLDKPEVASIPNKDVYERLVRATSTIDEKKLKDMIYQNFIVEIKNDDGSNQEEDENVTVSNVERRRLIALLQNENFQNRIMKDNGAIDRIYTKVAENNINDSRDVIASFEAQDFYVDINFCDDLVKDEADRHARKMADMLLAEPSTADKIANYMNKHVDVVIQRCAGLEPGDFAQVFIEIRKEIKRQGKNLTLLIEDVTAFTGVNVALLNVLITEHTGMYEDENLCRISSIIGTTLNYYGNNFQDNHKDRVTQFISIPDDVFGENEHDLCEFVGRYLNAMSLERETIDTWLNNGALPSDLPIHTVLEGNKWDSIDLPDGKQISLYPFTKRAIVYLYNHLLQDNYKTPRYLLRDVVERTVRDALFNFERFPGFKIPNENVNSKLMDRLRMQNMDSELMDRMYLFMCIWGDSTDEVYEESGTTHIAGIPVEIYNELGFPIISGSKVNPKTKEDNQTTSQVTKKIDNTVVKTPMQIQEEKRESALLAKYNECLQILENWIAGGTINVGSTTGDVSLLTNAREDMCNYLYSAINWQAECVSMDNIFKIKMVKSILVGFERQKRAEDMMFYKLPANRITQGVIEAFLAWNVLGKKSWEFEGADRMVYRVQVWTEKIKDPLIAAVTSFENRPIDYFKCAVTAEMYRLILFGLYKGTTIDGIKPEMLLDNNLKKTRENSHSKEWNNLLDIMLRTDSDKQNKENVVQYFNLIQGDRKSSQVFVDKIEFNKVVREIKSNKMVVADEVLQLFDPVRPRRDSREYLQKIQDRIAKVREGEVELAKEKMDIIVKHFETDDIDDEDIMDLLSKISEFYDEANISQVNVKYDITLIEAVKSDVKSIGVAIGYIRSAFEKVNSLECIMLFAQDPLRRIEKLIQLLDKVDNDVQFIKNDMRIRKAKLGADDNGNSNGNKYSEEKAIIEQCKTIISGMEV